jgi:hypothetical protein
MRRTTSWRGVGPGGVVLLGLLEALAVGLDVDDFGAMDDAVDERARAAG